MRHLYLAATGQNRGKTTAALGFLDGFLSRGLSTGFMKPVGQRTVIEDGVPADEDAVLMKSVFDLPDGLSLMSPVHIPRGFTKAYIAGEVVEDLGAYRQQPNQCRPRPRAEHDLEAPLEGEHLGVEARARDDVRQEVLDVVELAVLGQRRPEGEDLLLEEELLFVIEHGGDASSRPRRLYG